MTDASGVSVVIPITERFDDLPELFASYRRSLETTGRRLQFIFSLDGKFADIGDAVRKLDAGPHQLQIVTLTRTFGESSTLSHAFDHAEFDLVLTLPAYHQIEADRLPALFDALQDADMVVARRWPRNDSLVNRLSSKAFHFILQRMTHVQYSDLGCGVRLMRREVTEEVTVYGDQHRFLPLLADRRGFRVVEMDLPQARQDNRTRIYSPRVYVSRLLDLMSVFFVVRFTKKPLRFFGMVGAVLITAGITILLVTVFQRYFMQMPMTVRPIIMLGSLALVLGVQLFALGLIGELIIFTHAKDFKEYAVAETINFPDELADERAESPDQRSRERSAEKAFIS